MRVKKLIFLLLAASLLFGCSQAPAVPAGEAPEVPAAVEEAARSIFSDFPADGRMISPEVVFFRVEEGKELFLVDLRSRGDYEAGHIRGAVSLPWGEEFAARVQDLPADREIIVYCQSGQHSSQAVSLLKAAGVDAKSMQLGFGFGFSRIKGYEAAVDTERVLLEERNLPVDPDLQAAFERYFSEMRQAGEEGFLYYQMPEATLKEWVDAKKDDFFLVDLRAQAVHDEGHIQGTDLRLDFGPEMQERFSEIPADRPVVLYCYSGQTSSQVLGALRLLGYEALSLTGGMGTPGNVPIGWLNRNFPLVK